MSKILLVEGDGEALGLLKSALELEGHEVSPVQDGQAGINNGMKRCPDLLILGTDLGAKDGGSVYRALMGLHGQERFKALFISKPENPIEIPPAWKNVIGQFEKPVNEKEIVERIRSQLGTPEAKPPGAASAAEGTAPQKERRSLPKELRGLSPVPHLQKDRAGIDKLEEALRSFPRATILKKPIKKKYQMGLWLLLLFIWGGGGAAFYFLYWKPKHQPSEERVDGVPPPPPVYQPPPPPPEEPLPVLYEKAKGYDTAGSGELAIMAYKRVIEKGAKSDSMALASHLRLGELHLGLGRYDEALKHYDEYIKFAPSEASRAEAILKTANIYFYKKVDVRNALKRCQICLSDPASSAKTKSEAGRLQEKVQKERVVSDIMVEARMDIETGRKAAGKEKLKAALKRHPNTIYKPKIRELLEQ